MRSSLGFTSTRSNISSSTVSNSIAPREEAINHKAECLAWISAANAALQIVRTLTQSGLIANFSRLTTMTEFQTTNIHFKLEKHPNPLKFLSNLRQSYALMPIAIGGAEKHFDSDFLSDAFANVDPRGFATRNDAVNPGKMFFCSRYLSMGSLSKVVTIIHEAGHYISNRSRACWLQ